MGNNSIKSCMSKEDVVSTLRLNLCHPESKNSVHIIVEGFDDIRLFKKFYHDAEIHQSFSGKKGVVEIVESIFHNKKNVIGIRDKDYLNSNQFSKTFLTDYSCLETLIISNDISFKNFSNEFCINGIDCLKLRLDCLNAVKCLGLIRKMNEEINLSILFKGLSITSVFCQENECVDIDKLEKKLVKLNDPCKISKIDFEIVKEFAEEIHTLNDLLYLVNGHDFLDTFKLMCERSSKKYNIDVYKICLRSSFRFTEFKETVLYKSIDNYLNENVV